MIQRDADDPDVSEDWRIEEATDLQLGQMTFERLAWEPPPPEWVEVFRDATGKPTGASIRDAPGPPGWKEGEYPAWDHDHCAVCNQRLAQDAEYEDGERAGWRTATDLPDYEWVCDTCFEHVAPHVGWSAKT